MFVTCALVYNDFFAVLVDWILIFVLTFTRIYRDKSHLTLQLEEINKNIDLIMFALSINNTEPMKELVIRIGYFKRRKTIFLLVAPYKSIIQTSKLFK